MIGGNNKNPVIVCSVPYTYSNGKIVGTFIILIYSHLKNKLFHTIRIFNVELKEIFFIQMPKNNVYFLKNVDSVSNF